MEMIEVGPCEPYEMGFLIGQKFSNMIRSRVAKDPVIQQLLPFSCSTHAQSLINKLTIANRTRFPRYWDELVGTANGSGVSVLDITLLNFRKEILPFMPKNPITVSTLKEANTECSDILVVNDLIAIAAHNEDANPAIIGHVYLVKATLSNGSSFTAYTYAGELPSCAFGFNSHGLAFTLNSVPPSEEEIVAGRIGRNFISRDLLEATGLEDALRRLRSSDISVGHSYNLVDLRSRKILNVETASRNRISTYDIGATPFFHANMYLHLQVQQVRDENSISRQRRAAQLSKEGKTEILSVLGDSTDEKYPIYMEGPALFTLCTVLIDLDRKTVSILQGNPRNKQPTHVFSMS